MDDFPLSRTATKSGKDVFLVAKRYMADRSVHRLIALVPADTVRAIRLGFQEPQGVAARRPIGRNVLSNIQRYLPRCRSRGDIPQAAAEYLERWTSGTLEPVPRPASYPILRFRWRAEDRQEAFQPGSWVKPHRKRHIDVKPSDIERENSASDSDEGEIAMPRALTDDVAAL